MARGNFERSSSGSSGARSAPRWNQDTPGNPEPNAGGSGNRCQSLHVSAFPTKASEPESDVGSSEPRLSLRINSGGKRGPPKAWILRKIRFRGIWRDDSWRNGNVDRTPHVGGGGGDSGFQVSPERDLEPIPRTEEDTLADWRSGSVRRTILLPDRQHAAPGRQRPGTRSAQAPGCSRIANGFSDPSIRKTLPGVGARTYICPFAPGGGADSRIRPGNVGETEDEP